MLFEKKFKVVEIQGKSVTVTRFKRGSKKELEKSIESYKQLYGHYEMMGKGGMVVWS